MTTIQKHTELIVWQKAHKFVLEAYLAVSAFPDFEKFALSSQIRRAAISITSNIVEGFYRKSVKDKCHFYIMSRASLKEVKYQFFLAKDLKYLPEEKWQILLASASEVGRLLNGWIKVQK